MIPAIFISMLACFSTNVLAEEPYAAESSAAVQINNPYVGGWSNCTWSAWEIALAETGIQLPPLGSAGSWLNRAAAMGYAVGTVPAAGSIIVWNGHVGYVSAVSEDGQQVYVKEGGYLGGYHEEWAPAYSSRNHQALLGYIYLTCTPYGC